MHSMPTTTNRFDYIDALRGVAILMVMAVHSSQSVTNLPALVAKVASYGQMGVQLFFVLSAITLCYSINQKPLNQPTLVSFYLRRFFRIAPLYYVGMLLYGTITVLKNYHSLHHFAPGIYTVKNVASNVFFIHGFVPEAYNNIVPGGWSIGTEMAFYAVFPFLFWLFQSEKQYQRLGFQITLIGVSFATVAWLKDQLELWFLFSNLINMLPVFIVGIFYFNHQKFHNTKYLIPSKTGSVLAFLLALALSFYSFLYDFQITLSPLLSGIAFLLLQDVFKQFPGLNGALLKRIGQLSYSIYVFHFVFAWYVSVFVNRLLETKLPAVMVYLVCFLITVTGTFLVALASEKWIEKPGIALGKQMIQKYQNTIKNKSL